MRRKHPLEEVEHDLKVSPRRRLELIEELGADAEALQEALERRGHRPARARRAALRQLVPTEEALSELEAQHAPALGRRLRAAGWLDRAERVGIAGATILAGAAALVAVRWHAPAGAAAILAWPQVAVVAFLATNWTRAAKRLWIDGDLRPEPRRRLWERQVGLVVAAVALGALGAAWEGYTALGALEAEAAATPALWEAVRRGVSFAALGVGAAICGLFGWLAITPRLISDETIEGRISRLFAPSPLTLTSSARTSATRR
ncbi:hypothetical protein [Candidatus Palauibacter sp.]|uniref:hypothetical protein n=1 Tax=Candidatus Palauibacter sp. TaxID=3101350 RepID=UPI003AF2F390